MTIGAALEGELSDVPLNVVTATFTVPGVSPGASAHMVVGLTTPNSVRSGVSVSAPKLTDRTDVRCEPVIVTLVPPTVEPCGGESDVIVGRGVVGPTAREDTSAEEGDVSDVP